MPPERPIRAVLIAGPTASGKSALALALAKRFGGLVANADASQVYADLRVLTARPDEAEEAAAPHALYGHVDAAEPYAVGRWLQDATALLDRMSKHSSQAFPQARLPIFVGGTGLYFEALTAGLAAVPEIPEEVRARWRTHPAEELHEALRRRDPVMAARLRTTDPQRLARALEVVEATGRSLADWQNETTPGPLLPEDALLVALAPERPWLRERIGLRLDAMVAAGAVEEARRLDARGLDPSLPAMKALGVRPFAAFVRGEIPLDDAIARTRLDTGRYAKRQSTWFRNRMAGWALVSPDDALAVAEAEIARRGLA